MLSSTKPPYTVTGIIIHKLAASLFKPRGSKRGEKVAAYSPEITVQTQTQSPVYYSHNHQSITDTITSLLQTQSPVYYSHNHQSITVTNTITSPLKSQSPVYYSHRVCVCVCEYLQWERLLSFPDSLVVVWHLRHHLIGTLLSTQTAPCCLQS